MCPACCAAILETFRWNVSNGLFLSRDWRTRHAVSLRNISKNPNNQISKAKNKTVLKRCSPKMLIQPSESDKRFCSHCRDRLCRVRRFMSRYIPLKTFHRNVSKIKELQAGHRAERSCSLRPRKAIAFLTHLLRAPRAWRREFRRLRTATQRATRPLRTPRQLCSVGSALWGNNYKIALFPHDGF